MGKVFIMDHPLVHHKLAVLRNKETPVKEFRELVSEIAGLMCYEATRNLPTEEVEVQTPVALAALAAMARGENADGAALQPNYLRLSQAERERMEKLRKNNE